MFTDLVGYTTQTHRDEPRSLRLLADHRKLVRATVAKFGGREVKTMGDGFLIDFSSALSAVLCAVELQRRSAAWAGESQEDRPQVRIAVHVGDVVDDGSDILGDAVNVASRIEALVEPGGICVSRPVFEQVRNKVPCDFVALPPTQLRGVDVPVELYRVELIAGVTASHPAAPPTHRIAVLPFASISPDPKDEYFADGLTEELITVLSQLSELRVIARTSVTPYKATTKGVTQIASELRVGSVLEGSVRKSGNRLRVTAQLIDAKSQGHVWAATYDRELDDVFALQAEIAHQVAAALRVTILEQEERRLRTRPTGVTESYLAYLKGRTLFRGTDLVSLTEAVRQFELAIRLDPENARAFSGLADATYRRAQLSGQDFDSLLASHEAARELASRSIRLDPSAAEAHASLGCLHDEIWDFSDADRELRRAISLNPSYAIARQWYARLLTEQGRLEEALEQIRLAEEADPLSPSVQFDLTMLLLALARSDEMAIALQRLSELDADGLLHHLARLEMGLQGSTADEIGQETAWLLSHPPASESVMLQAYWTAKHRAGIGDRSAALLQLQRLDAICRPGSQGDSSRAPALMAEVYAQLGDLDECFRRLEMAFSARAIAFEYWWTSPSFQAVRGDPRFRAMLGRAHLV